MRLELSQSISYTDNLGVELCKVKMVSEEFLRPCLWNKEPSMAMVE